MRWRWTDDCVCDLNRGGRKRGGGGFVEGELVGRQTKRDGS